ncbi:MAG: tryptophan-rich sensory protein [Alphaproteobacteria bacterium]|nr:tryptophan-rich sensory protein [Alphaproteobacteria bacterium]
MKKIFQFILAMIISYIPGFFGVVFTPHNASDAWYNALNKSVLTPDGWVFSVAWTILYALLGWALYLIISNDKTRFSKARAYWLFVIQLVLNFMWTYAYFGLHMLNLAMLILIALIVIAIWMAYVFKPISKTASYLVWPYIVWMLFAAYLNGAIIYLN